MEQPFSQLSLADPALVPMYPLTMNNLWAYEPQMPMLFDATERLGAYVASNMISTNGDPEGYLWHPSAMKLHKDLARFLASYQCYTYAADTRPTPLIVRAQTLPQRGFFSPEDVVALARGIAEHLGREGCSCKIREVNVVEGLDRVIDLVEELERMLGMVALDPMEFDLVGHGAQRFVGVLTALAMVFIEDARKLHPRVWEGAEEAWCVRNELYASFAAGWGMRGHAPELQGLIIQRLAISPRCLDGAHTLCEFVTAATGRADRGLPAFDNVLDVHTQITHFLGLALSLALLEGDMGPGQEGLARLAPLTTGAAAGAKRALSDAAVDMMMVLLLSGCLDGAASEAVQGAVHSLCLSIGEQDEVYVTEDWRLVGEEVEWFLRRVGWVVEVVVKVSRDVWPGVFVAA